MYGDMMFGLLFLYVRGSESTQANFRGGGILDNLNMDEKEVKYCFQLESKKPSRYHLERDENHH